MKAGNPERFIIAVIMWAAMAGIPILGQTSVAAERAAQKEIDIDRFRDLKWGTSIEQASEIYRDLYFERYVVSDGREEPAKVYVRRAERVYIEDVKFDSIEYWFKRGHFYLVRAVLQSRIGPRTLVTRAENAYDKITGRLTDRYGNPRGRKVEYVTERIVVVKEATWVVDHSAVTVKYEGAGRANEDSLILTMREKRGR